MIEFIRKRLNSVFVLLLLGLLIASFAFFGIGDVVQVGQGDTIAKVGNRRITVVELAQSFETLVKRQQAENPEVTNAQAIRAGVDTAILQQLIQQALITQSAQKMGLSASPKKTQAMVAALPAFQLAGQFDLATYKSTLASRRISEEELFADMEKQQILDQVQTALAGTAYVPQALANAQIAALLETRTADAMLLPVSAFEDQVSAPTQAQLEAYFDTVRSAYNAPEYRVFKVVYLTPDAVAQDIEVREEDILQAYEFRKDEFGNKAELDLQLVVFDTPEEAAAFKAKAVNGARYLELAEDTGASRDDISIGALTRPEIENLYGDDVAQTLFDLSAGDVSEPLDGPFGFLVFRIAGKTTESFQSYDELKEELEAEVAQQLALDRLADIGNAFEDEFAAGATLEEAAKTFGIDAISYDMVTDTGMTDRGTLAPQQSNLQTILPDVFATELDNELEVERLGEGGYYIARIDDITPSRPQELEEVKQRVSDAWTRSEIDRLALAAADGLAQQVRDGASMQTLGEDNGYQLLSGVSFNRVQAQQGSLANADLAPLLFSLEKGDVDVARSGGGDSYVIAKLLKVEDGDAGGNRVLVDQFRTQIATYMKQERLQQFITGQATTIKSNINQRALQTFRKLYDPTL